MGKKQKKKNSSLNASQLSNDSKNISLNSSSKDSFQCEEPLPESFLVSSVEREGCELYARALKSEWKDIVFLHPLVMREFNIEDLVLIKGEEKYILCNAYPVQKLKRSVIVFPKGNSPFKCQELVTLQKYEEEVRPANEILVAFDGENMFENMEGYILQLLNNQYIFKNLEVKWQFFDRCYQCIIKSINNSSNDSRASLDAATPKFYTVSHTTSLKVIESENKPAICQIGGLKNEMKVLNTHLQNFLNRSTYCQILLLEGPSGTGKSLLLQTVLKDYAIFTENIIWRQLCAMSQTEVKQALEKTFQRIVDNAPSLIIIEEFNYLCPSKNDAESLHLYISKTISQFLKTLNDTKVMLIATVNSSEYDTSVLQQSGKLMEKIKFKIPSSDERIDILYALLKNCDHELTCEQIEMCARLSHGFTGKDLMETIRDAQVIAYKRKFSDVFDSSEFLNIVKNKNGNINIKYGDLYFCIKLKKKSIVTAGDIKVRKLQWSDIGGMSAIKEKLREIVEWPIIHAEAFKNFNISPSRGVLMYGPPGCSKTMIAKALATECELNFISKNAADLYDKYVGESEKAVRDLFALAKAKSPCIIFLDEIDALVTGRESSSGSSGVGNRIVTTLLTEMDGVEELHGVIIIAATNRPDMLDDALVRNGRINHFIYVSLPDAATREEILKINMRNRTVSEDFDFKTLVEKTEGYSGAEIVNLCNEAALQLLAENPQSKSPIFRLHHFESALNYVLPRSNKEMIEFYESFNKNHCT